jgi:SAM-dependent methyltransferase
LGAQRVANAEWMHEGPMPTTKSAGTLDRGRSRDWLTLGERSTQRELLDEPELDPAQLGMNLRDLARLNRLPGGTAGSVHAIELLAEGARRVSIVDVGTGAGDMPLAFARHGRARRGDRWQVLAFDTRPEILAHAERRLRREPDVQALLGDGRRLPLDDGEVDIAHASLLLHHLDPPDAVALLAELRRVARRGVVINDLQRGLRHLIATAATVLVLGRCAYTRRDGILSAQRAYTLAELDELLAAAGLRVVSRSARFLPRVVTAAAPV